jgi:hypothetical protein
MHSICQQMMNAISNRADLPVGFWTCETPYVYTCTLCLTTEEPRNRAVSLKVLYDCDCDLLIRFVSRPTYETACSASSSVFEVSE